ncbi:MAG: hypothetical protein ABII79_06450 [bacterium]
MKGCVLLICYDFPPVGGPAIGRPVGLYKYLPLCSYKCDVLTVKPTACRVKEPELLDGVESGRIHRSGSHDPQRLMYLLGIRRVRNAVVQSGKRASRRFFPDHKVGWVRPAIRMGRTLLSNYRYDVLISTSPPISNHLVARQLSLETDTPWIADFRDFWSLYKAEDTYQNERQVTKAQVLLQTIRKQATLVTAVNPSIADYVRADEVIYNSYDPEFAALWRTPNDHEHLVIGLLGTFDEICPVEPLLKMIAVVREKQPRLFNKIRLLQVGRVDSRWLSLQLERYDLTDTCDCHGFQSRAGTIRILSDASLFYVSVASEKESGVIPGRIYTLLASGRPIMAAVPHGSEVEKLLAPTGNSFCFTKNNITNAANYLCEQISLSENDGLAISPMPDYARMFSSEQMARRFAGLLDKIHSR